MIDLTQIWHHFICGVIFTGPSVPSWIEPWQRFHYGKVSDGIESTYLLE